MKRTIKFDKRPEAGGPVYVASYNFGDVIDNWEPEVGNGVILHSGSVVVLARISAASSKSYTGRIIGFENHNEYEFEGMKPDDEIAFEYSQVFGVSR